MKIKGKHGATLNKETADFVTLSLPLDSCPIARRHAMQYAEAVAREGDESFATQICETIVELGGV